MIFREENKCYYGMVSECNNLLIKGIFSSSVVNFSEIDDK